MPDEDKFLTTKGQLEDAMAMTLGGRAAEEIVFDEITTGAANDLEKVTQTAKQMTMRFGMSDKLGPRVLGHNQGAPFLGRDMHSEPDYSDDMARTIDSEIRRIIEEAHQRARDILVEHRGDLETLSQILLSARRSSARSSWPCSRAPPRRASSPSATAAPPSSRPRPSARPPSPRRRASACPTRPPATPSPRAEERPERMRVPSGARPGEPLAGPGRPATACGAPAPQAAPPRSHPRQPVTRAVASSRPRPPARGGPP